MPTPLAELTFHLDGQPVPYRLRLSARCRRMGLRFSDEGLEVVKPPRLADASHDFLFRRFEGWIRRQMRRRRVRLERLPAAPGRILLRGRETAVEIREAGISGGLRASAPVEGRVSLEVSRGRLDLAAGTLRSFIFAEATRDLSERLALRSREMDQPFGSMSVRDQKSLWGSCSPRTGVLSFNARLVMAPPGVLDYIVVHELAHFRWSGHGARFWALVARHCPDYAACRRWLRDNAWRLRIPATTDEMSPFLVE